MCRFGLQINGGQQSLLGNRRTTALEDSGAACQLHKEDTDVGSICEWSRAVKFQLGRRNNFKRPTA